MDPTVVDEEQPAVESPMAALHVDDTPNPNPAPAPAPAPAQEPYLPRSSDSQSSFTNASQPGAPAEIGALQLTHPGVPLSPAPEGNRARSRSSAKSTASVTGQMEGNPGDANYGKFSKDDHVSTWVKDKADEYDYCVVLPMENGELTEKSQGYAKKLKKVGKCIAVTYRLSYFIFYFIVIYFIYFYTFCCF